MTYVDVEKYIPGVLDSPKAKRPLSKINVKVLDKNAKVGKLKNLLKLRYLLIFQRFKEMILFSKTIANAFKSCERGSTVFNVSHVFPTRSFYEFPADVQERNNEIIMLESSARPVSSINASESSKKKSRCCCVIS